MSSTLADLIERPIDYYLHSWNRLSPQTREVMNTVFELAFDHDWDYSKGFTYHHLSLINVSDVKAIKQLDFAQVLSALGEIEDYIHHRGYYDEDEGWISIPKNLDDETYYRSVCDEVIRNATSIEELLEAIINRLEILERIPDRDLTVLRSRADWLTSNPRTLDSIAEEYKLSRERIRQIGKKYEDPLSDVTGTLKFAKQLSDVAMRSRSVDDLQIFAIEAGLTASDSLDLAQCEAISRFLPSTEGWSGFIQQRKKWMNQDEVMVDLSRSMNKFRSKLGFIDASYASQELGLPIDQTVLAIRERYPRSVISGSLVLARTDKLVSTFESSVAKQLLVVPELSASEILVGARRHGSIRNDSMSGADLDYINIIHSICGNPPSLQTFLSSQLYPTELSDSDHWLISIFKSSPNGLLHRVEVTRLAIESKMNLGSITAYCASSPIVRMHSSGMYSLIGVRASYDQVAMQAELALARDGAVEIDLKFEGSNVWVHMNPNLNAFASGVILPSRELKDIFSGSFFTPECLCGAIDSKQILKVSKDGFWMGFQSIFSHGLQSHDFGMNSVFRIFFDFDCNRAILHP